MVSAITKHTPFVCAVVDQLTTSRKSVVLHVATQLLGPGSVSLLVLNNNINPAEYDFSSVVLTLGFGCVFFNMTHVRCHKMLQSPLPELNSKFYGNTDYGQEALCCCSFRGFISFQQENNWFTDRQNVLTSTSV